MKVIIIKILDKNKKKKEIKNKNRSRMMKMIILVMKKAIKLNQLKNKENPLSNH